MLFLIGQELFLPAVFPMLHPGLVMRFDLFGDGYIERVQVKKGMVPQFGIYPAIDEFYLVLHQGFILWSSRARRGHRATVMVGKILQDPVYFRLIIIGLYYGGFQVIGDQWSG